MQISDQGFVLHRRPWRETSQLLECLTREHGRIGLVARGSRRRAGTGIELFTPLTLGWRGRGDLFTLVRSEPERAVWLTGRCATVGLYANELLMKLVERNDPEPGLYAAYATLLEHLERGAGEVDELALRSFELRLLETLGYGFSLAEDADEGLPLQGSRTYTFDPDAGFRNVGGSPGQGLSCWSGAVLLKIAAGELETPEARAAAREIFRAAIDRRLEGRELVTRRIWQPGSS